MKRILTGVISLLLIICSLLYINMKNKKEEPIVLKDPEYKISTDLTTNLIRLTSRDNKDNYLISPYSIKVALNMLKEGADNNTLKEINKLLEGSKQNNIDNENIKIANAVFINNRVKDKVEETFTNTIRNTYKGEVLYDEFKTPKVINNWVYEHTNKMIPKVIDNIDPTVFVAGIANAIAIDVKWNYQFDCPLTTKEEFTQKNGKTINAQMMHHTYENEDVSYIDNDKITGIILPYQPDTNLEFIGFVSKTDIDYYLKNITTEDLINIDKDAISGSRKLHINLSMPRFKYEFDLSTFKEMLLELGMRDAFDAENADFTKIITRENQEGRNIYVDEAIHKAAIDLNETGTKATAVTYFGLKDAAALMPEDFKTVNIELNKTFIYMIREKTTKEILFFGVVNTPNKWSGSTCKEA